MPRITIGIPVYNGAITIERAIESLLDQTYADFEIVISDNDSDDETQILCEYYARSDSRVRYTRQRTNIGIINNFRFLLNLSQAEYFMWAPANDFWEKEYVSANVSVLERDPNVVCSVSKVIFKDKDRGFYLAHGTRPFNHGTRRNLVSFLSRPSDNSRVLGVFRTKCLKQVFPKQDMFAIDWAISAASLMHGKHYEVDKALMIREKTPTKTYLYPDKFCGLSLPDRILPLAKCTRHLLFEAGIPKTPSILLALLYLNVVKAGEYAYYNLRRKLSQADMNTGNWPESNGSRSRNR